jgi:hypothetical protein
MPKSDIGGVSHAMTLRANGLEIVVCLAPRMLLRVPVTLRPTAEVDAGPSRQAPPARPRSSRGDGQTVVILTSRRAADVVAGPRPRERALGAL